MKRESLCLLCYQDYQISSEHHTSVYFVRRTATSIRLTKGLLFFFWPILDHTSPTDWDIPHFTQIFDYIDYTSL